jgi:hypothetical protein
MTDPHDHAINVVTKLRLTTGKGGVAFGAFARYGRRMFFGPSAERKAARDRRLREVSR